MTTGGEQKNLPDNECTKQIETTMGGKVFRVTCAHDLQFRDGVSEETPTGTKWTTISDNV